MRSVETSNTPPENFIDSRHAEHWSQRQITEIFGEHPKVGILNNLTKGILNEYQQSLDNLSSEIHARIVGLIADVHAEFGVDSVDDLNNDVRGLVFMLLDWYREKAALTSAGDTFNQVEIDQLLNDWGLCDNSDDMQLSEIGDFYTPDEIVELKKNGLGVGQDAILNYDLEDARQAA